MSKPQGVISARVARAQSGRDPELLATMPAGFAVLNAAQPQAIRGCCMLVPAEVVSSPNVLSHEARAQFFVDLLLLGDAVLEVTGAERINYLVLCNQAPELHGHCIPRFATEDAALRLQGPFEAYDFGAAPSTDALGTELELATQLKHVLERLLREREGKWCNPAIPPA